MPSAPDRPIFLDRLCVSTLSFAKNVSRILVTPDSAHDSRRVGRAIAVIGVVVVHIVAGWLLIQPPILQESVVPKPIEVFLRKAPLLQRQSVALPLFELTVVQTISTAIPEIRIQVEFPGQISVNETAGSPSHQESQAINDVLDQLADLDERVVLKDSEVDYLVRPVIHYPIAAKRMKEQGVVWLSVLVDERGCVTQVSVLKSAGSLRLDEAAIRALRLTRFRPYIRSGIAMRVKVQIPVEFSLVYAS